MEASKVYNILRVGTTCVLLSLPLLHFYFHEVVVLELILFCFSMSSLVLLVLISKRESKIIPVIYSLLIFTFYVCNSLFHFLELFILLRWVFVLNVMVWFAFNPFFSSKILNKAVFVIVCAQIILFIYSVFYPSFWFFPNDSLFSILLATELAFLIPFIAYRVEKLTPSSFLSSLIFIILFFLSVFLLFTTKGRAGLASFVVAALVFNLPRLKRLSISFKILLSVILISGVGILFFQKYGSSQGRLLIYKVVYHEFPKHKWIKGIGYGHFRSTYNQWQANYFSAHNIDTKEALLAGDNYFMFNDFIQFVIETGIVGLIIIAGVFLFLIYSFFFHFKRDFCNNKSLQGAYLALFCFFVGASFSYPFQIISFLPILVLPFIIILKSYSILQLSKCTKFKIWDLPITNLFSLAACILLLIIFVRVNYIYLYMEKTENLYNAGFKKRTAQVYSFVRKDMVLSPNFYFDYATVLSDLKMTDLALAELNKYKRFIYNDQTAKLIAKLYFDKKDFSRAEQYFKDAVFINPKLFRNRYDLFQFYLETGQSDKAVYWGNSILQLEPKIPSVNVDLIKEKTTGKLRMLLETK